MPSLSSVSFVRTTTQTKSTTISTTATVSAATVPRATSPKVSTATEEMMDADADAGESGAGGVDADEGLSEDPQKQVESADCGPCSDYQINMRAANFGDCICGFPKKGHLPAAFQSNKKKSHAKLSNRCAQVWSW